MALKKWMNIILAYAFDGFGSHKASMLFIVFNSNQDRCLTDGAAISFPRLLAANVSIIKFNQSL
jgi:hypothetical protein